MSNVGSPAITEAKIRDFWNENPCGEHLIGETRETVIRFFDAYDEYRYRVEPHILRCIDQLQIRGKSVLEIGLGQGADSEQLIRRGAHWSGLDLTPESIHRVRTRLTWKNLPFDGLQVGSILDAPFPDKSFDVIFSHGVLHHIPDIQRAQKEIHRLLKPDGKLIVMLYSKYSLNYLASIALVRRLGLLGLMALPISLPPFWETHRKNARSIGLFQYLKLKNFIHSNTDGPNNPYSKVYDLAAVASDFPCFSIEKHHKHFMHAPPLPVHGWPGEGLLGWHLWVHLKPLANRATNSYASKSSGR
jgi:SAM-dependent methyltransferase